MYSIKMRQRFFYIKTMLYLCNETWFIKLTRIFWAPFRAVYVSLQQVNHVSTPSIWVPLYSVVKRKQIYQKFAVSAMPYRQTSAINDLTVSNCPLMLERVKRQWYATREWNAKRYLKIKFSDSERSNSKSGFPCYSLISGKDGSISTILLIFNNSK